MQPASQPENFIHAFVIRLAIVVGVHNKFRKKVEIILLSLEWCSRWWWWYLHQAFQGTKRCQLEVVYGACAHDGAVRLMIIGSEYLRAIISAWQLRVFDVFVNVTSCPNYDKWKNQMLEIVTHLKPGLRHWQVDCATGSRLLHECGTWRVVVTNKRVSRQRE